MSSRVTVITDSHHSQESTMPTLRSPTSYTLYSQSRDVFQRLTVSRPAVEAHTAIAQVRPRSRGWPSDDFQGEMMKKLIRSQAKIKVLREQMEKERMKEVRTRPRISGRSRELAAKVNDRFFARFNAQCDATRVSEAVNREGKDKENEAENGKLGDAMDFLDPEDTTGASHIRANMHDRIRHYLASPSVHKHNQSAIPTQPVPETQSIQPGRSHHRIGSTLSPVIRRVSYDSGCNLTRYLC